MDAQIIHACIDGIAGLFFSSSFSDPLPLLLWTLPLREKAPFRGFVKNSWAGQETWCNAGGNTASDGDPRISSGEPMVEAQMARTMGNIGSQPGWASYRFRIDCGWVWNK